jgi:hypothetical protein
VIGIPLLAMAVTAGCWLSAQVGSWAPAAAPTAVTLGADAVQAHADAVPADAGARAVAVTGADRSAIAQADLAYPAAIVAAEPLAGAATAPPAPGAVPATGADPSSRAQRAPPARLA